MSLLETRNGMGRAPDQQLAPPNTSSAATVQPPAHNIAARARAVAAIAAKYAVVVDGAARFPIEAIEAAKEQRLLGILVPVELGGEGASISDAVDACYILGRACGSTGLIYAMHQMMLACVVRHRLESRWHSDLLRRVASEQLLIASSTTEGQRGGDLRKSECAVEPASFGMTVSKSATVMSYGLQADVIITTARRSPDASASDQVLAAFHKDQYSLETTGGWDTLGMRGTCSGGFNFHGAGGVDQLLPEPYQKIHAQTGMPVAHLTWSAVWTGVATDAVDRARAFVRNAARNSGGQLPPGAVHLTRATASLRTLRAVVASALARYETASGDAQILDSLEFQTGANLLKVTASELAIATVSSALQACGLAGYRNDGEFSITRSLRDAMSSSVMINNDRILSNVATASLLVELPALLTK